MTKSFWNRTTIDDGKTSSQINHTSNSTIKTTSGSGVEEKTVKPTKVEGLKIAEEDENRLMNRVVGFVRKQTRFLQTKKMPTNDGFDGDGNSLNENCSRSITEETDYSSSESVVELSHPQRDPYINHFHPRPPFSCTPIYSLILFSLLLVLIVSAVHTIIDMRPSILFGSSTNDSPSSQATNETSETFQYSTLKPQ